jgi:signal transduction histidine kinase
MSDLLPFLAGGGRAADMIRARDWAGHPLGPPETWPEALRTALSLVLNSPESMILAWGPDLHFFFNETYFPLLGPRLGWAMGERFDRVWADGWEQAKPIIDDALAGRSRRFVDLPWKLGTDRGEADTWWTFSYSRVLDGEGRVSGLFILTNETTAQVTATRRLRESEAIARENIERVRLALSAGAIIGTWFWDLPTDRFTVDEAFARSFGLDPALGREGLSLEQVIETVHPDDRAGLIAAIDAVVIRGGAYAHQYRTRRADGQYYWLEVNGRVDHAPDGTPLSFPGVLIDVDERRAVEAERDRATAMLRALTETLEQRVAERTAELMRAEEALRQSQKMEAVGQLTGGLAHDFNNLLAGISGSLELIQTRIGQGRLGEVDRYVDAAQGAARRAAALTHRLLAFSRRQTLDPRPTDVNHLVAGMEELIRRTVGPAIAIATDGPTDLWTVLVDPPQLENALLNLCLNARDAMPEGGRIAIEASNHRLDDAAAREHDLPPGEYLCLRVTDTGGGMTPAVIARAFDPFFTTKPLGQGRASACR